MPTHTHYLWFETKRRQEITLEEHEKIVAALEKRDTAAAIGAMEAHLAAVMTELEAFARQRPELFADLNTGEITA